MLALSQTAILAIATAPLTLIAGTAAATAVLVAVAVADTTGGDDQPAGESACGVPASRAV